MSGVAIDAEPRSIEGVRLGHAAAGIRKSGKDDVVLIEIAAGANAAAVFTRNAFCAAPVQVARAHLTRVLPRALIINAGNANAGTGAAGMRTAEDSCVAVAAALGCTADEVLPFSTGVIGEQLPVERLVAAIGPATAALDENGWAAAALAIMTTDIVAKIASTEIEAGGTTYRVTGMAKGSGMIHPNMATMLAYVATDANVPGPELDATLRRLVARTFNRITVDGDTSTNDACVLIATGAKRSPLTSTSAGWSDFEAALEAVFRTLAQAIARDGEGATKLVAVEVVGAPETDCERVAFTIAGSPLVKTALFAGDPNWGRLLAAIGRAPVAGIMPERISIAIGDYDFFVRGALVDGYEEARAAALFAATDVRLRIDLGGGGDAAATVWTCDLSYDYVRINAEYRS